MNKNINEIEAIEDVNNYIFNVNMYTQIEAKRCRILLARVLRELDILSKKLDEK